MILRKSECPSITWKDLSPVQRLSVVLAAIVQVVLLIAALQDIYKRPAEEIRGSKGAWTAISFINFIGPAAYFTWGRKPPAETA